MSSQATTQPDTIWITDAVKADGPMRVRILGGPHGTDRQGQTFDPSTDFGRAKHISLVYWHGFNDTGPRVTYIGEATKAERDGSGQWYVGELDDTPLGRQIYSDAMAGKARASSDAMAHLVRPKGILGKPGHVSAWPIGAISLMDAATAGTAINPGAVVNAVKAYLDGLESETGEASATKAGAAIAKRNRDRILRMKEMLDELLNEFPSSNEDAAMSAFGDYSAAASGTKSTQIMEDNIKPTEAAQPAAPAPVNVTIENKLPDIGSIVAEAVKANAPAPAPAPVGYSVEQVREAAEKAAAAVKAEYEQKLRDAQRPDLSPKAPAYNKGEQDTSRNAPFLWAAKASLATNGDPIVFNLNGARDGFEYDGTAAAKAAFKAMATTAGGDVGDHFIPLLQSSMVVDALYQEVVTRKIPGVTIYPMRSLIEYIPTLGSFSAGWSAENATATSAGDAATSRKTLTAKNLTALATVSNQLLQDSTPAVEAFIRNGLARAIGEAHDTGALYGTNASNQPLGVTDTASVVSTAASSDDFYTAVIKALGRMDANKTPMGGRYVLARPETIAKAAATRASTGGDFLGSQAPVGTVLAGQSGLAALVSGRLGVPVFSTTVIPTVTGASEIIVGYAPDFIIGDRQELEISSSKEAGSAFANNQTLIRAIMRVDFVLARSTSIELITGYLH